MMSTTTSRYKSQILDNTRKLTQIRSDIFFLSKCKEFSIIPNGLVVKNPLQYTYNTKFSQMHAENCQKYYAII